MLSYCSSEAVDLRVSTDCRTEQVDNTHRNELNP
jgi:hypothetical protein